jgi:hypothetical protein
VTGATDAEDLNVDPAGVADRRLVLAAVLFDLGVGQRAVGNVDVFFEDVDVIEQVLVHESHVALQLIGLHRKVLVEIERHDVAKGEALFLVQSH